MAHICHDTISVVYELYLSHLAQVMKYEMMKICILESLSSLASSWQASHLWALPVERVGGWLVAAKLAVWFHLGQLGIGSGIGSGRRIIISARIGCLRALALLSAGQRLGWGGGEQKDVARGIGLTIYKLTN